MATPEVDMSDNGDIQKERKSAEDNFEDPGKHHPSSKDKEEEELLHTLNNHFNDPYTRMCKGRGLGRVPEKLILLLFVWVLCTYQLVLFGNDRAQFADFLERNNIAMKHLLLKDWSPDYETMPYPPSTGICAIYTIDNLLKHINHTVTNVYNIPTTSVGSFFIRRINGTGGREKPVTLCLYYYETGIYNEDEEKIVAIDTTHKTVCSDIDELSPPEYGFQPSISDLMRSTDGKLVSVKIKRCGWFVCVLFQNGSSWNDLRALHSLQCLFHIWVEHIKNKLAPLLLTTLLIPILSKRLLSVSIDFKLSSVHLNAETKKAIQCYGIHGTVFFDNRQINGQIIVKLKTSVEEVKCSADSTVDAKVEEIVISALVLLFCGLHGLFCLYSCISSILLCKRTKALYKKKEKGKILSNRACWEIFKLNDLILCFSNIITIVGSVMKLSIDHGIQTNYIISMYDTTGILLGFGCLFTWMSVLHYLAYDHVFGLLFSVMERSAFIVLKFLACISILFTGFVLFAWVVLGPYHIKFASWTSTFQSLLAIMHGDEVYVTFTAIDSEKEIISYINVIFLVIFLALFTLVTLNIFIAIFNTAYERQHDNTYKKDHRSDLLKFIGRMETKAFDTAACVSCVKHCCPSMLGCMSVCDETHTIKNTTNQMQDSMLQ